MTWLAWPHLLALAGVSAAPLEVLDIKGPTLAHGGDQTSGKGCAPVHAGRLDELKPPWRGRVARISVKCEPMPGIDGEPDASIAAVAVLKPGTVALQGIAVVELRTSESWAHGETNYVLKARYDAIADKLTAHVRRQCLAGWKQTEAAPGGWCAVSADAEHRGVFIQTGELGGIWLHPDPDDSARTIYADAWSE